MSWPDGLKAVLRMSVPYTCNLACCRGQTKDEDHSLSLAEWAENCPWHGCLQARPALSALGKAETVVDS